MIYAFDDFELDTQTAELRKREAPIQIEPQVFMLLQYLLENPGQLVSRDDLIDAVWNGKFISNAAVDSRISLARSALGDNGKWQKFIKTVRGRGIRFVEPVRTIRQRSDGPAQTSGVSTSNASAGKTSIAVLPFGDLSNEQDQEYLADGIAEDIMTALSRAGWIFVASRSAVIAYKDEAVDERIFGKQLGVRYALKGSVRRDGKRLRITAQLIDIETGTHLWADKIDGTTSDIFDFQDRITECVVGAIEPDLRRAEIRRALAKPTSNLDAYDLYLRGVHQMYAATRASLDLAICHLQDALKIDPNYQLVKAYLALAYAIRDTPGWSQNGDAEVAIAMARDAIKSADDNPTILRTAGYALGYFASNDSLRNGENLDMAAATLQRSLELNPNSSQTLNSLGFVLLWSGQVNDAVACFERALTISPRDQETGYVLVGLATSFLILDKNEAAYEMARRAVIEMPQNSSAHRVFIVALVRLNRIQEAINATKRLIGIIPDATLSSVKPTSNPLGFADGFLSDLRKAGYPDDKR